ncbi:DUF2637 domain-containing protein [Catenulispora pinisilvae]|uniref:DUF2637 domain-containing protein n=1 Tax=Catenulispora pinisilvae TaxID=2705253 RepID=UPI00189237CA|nr:DUF2637 domain-containing protein [Catenulispora pinisilvae]
MTQPHHPAAPADNRNAGALISLTLLTSAVASIVIIGFLGSYGPLRDAFLAIHQSPAAASRDPWAVDGLIAVATAAAIWLKNKKVAHNYAVTVGAITTAASLLLNFLHGCGVIRPGGQTDGPLHPALVLIITSLPVGAIGFGSHLLIACVRNFRSRVPRTRDESGTVAIGHPDRETARKALNASPADHTPDRSVPPAQVSAASAVLDGPRAYGSQDRYRTGGPAELDPVLLDLGRKALAGLTRDGVLPTRDALRSRMGVGNSKASAVWTYLRAADERPKDGTALFELTDRSAP